MKFREETEQYPSKDFLRLKDGESHIGICMGDLYEFRTHWNGKNSEVCTENGTCQFCKSGDRPRFRFRVNFIVKSESGYEAKILDQGWTMYSALRELNTDYKLEENLIKIARRGSGINDTVYSVLPVKNGTLPADKIKLVSQVKLFDLTLQEHKEKKDDSKVSSFEDFEKIEELPF